MSVEIRDLEQYLLKILQPDEEKINGTGFFCHPAGYILTCYHVIEPHLNACKNEVNVIYKGEKHRTQIYKEYCIKDADIAVLKLIEPLESLKYLPLDVHDLWNIEDKIYSFGYPVGCFSEPGIDIKGSVGGRTIVEGISVIHISGLNLSEIDIGYSGAPVLNLKNEKVIGLINARYKKIHAFFVPLKILLDQWEEIKDFHDVFTKIRSKIAQTAQEQLNKRLRDSRFIPLNLECGAIPEKPEEKEQARGWAYGRKWEDFEFKTLPSSQRSYILSSSVGTGKTTFFYWLVTQLINTATVPIFMPCAEFERANPQNWNELKKQLTSDFNQDFLVDIESFFDTNFHNKKILFLFDGLDQIKGGDYSNLAKTIFKIASHNSVIVSSRPSSVISLESERDLLFLRLKPFSAEDEKLYFVDDYEKARSISRFAPDLIRIPMLAYMVKTLINEGKATDIFNRADIYKRFLDHIIYRHDLNVPLSSFPCVQKTKDIEKALRRISFDALNLKEPQIQKISISFYLERDFGIPVDELARFGLVNLILERGDTIQHSLFFTHQSFQEFLAAQYCDEHEELIERVINEMWSPKWKEVIIFLAGIRGQEIVEKIYSKDKKDNIIYSRLFLAAECLAEVGDVRRGIKEEINRKVRELIKIEPFRIDAISALRFVGDITCLKLLLRDSDSLVRRDAVNALAVLKDRVTDEVVKEIAGRLQDDDKFVRRDAVNALAELKDRVTDEMVMEIAGRLQDDEWDVCRAAVKGLAELKDRVSDEVVKEIAARLRDDNKFRRWAAVEALAELKDRVTDEVVKEIASWLRDNNGDVRSAAVKALAELKDRVTDEVVKEIVGLIWNDYEVVRRAMEALAELKEGETIKVVMEIAGNWDVRRAALKVLAELKDRVTDEAVMEFAARLRDDNWDVRFAALEILAALKDRVTDEAVMEIAARLQDDNWFVRGAAVNALVELKDRVTDEAVMEIATRLRDDNWFVRFAALGALVELKDRVIDEMVAEIAARLRDDNGDVRFAAVKALAELKDKVTDEAVMEIAARLRDDNWLMRSAALEALVELKDRVTDEVVMEIAARLRDDGVVVRSDAVKALVALKDRLTDEVVMEIACRLQDDNGFVRFDAVKALAELKGRVTDEMVMEIAGRLRDDNGDVRSDAVKALAELKGRVTDEVVMEIAGRLQDDDKFVRLAAVEALAELKDRVTDEVLKEIAARLRDDNEAVRRAAVNALVELKDRVTDEAVMEIATRLRDNNGDVRAGTYETLKIFYESGIPLPLEKSL